MWVTRVGKNLEKAENSSWRRFKKIKVKTFIHKLITNDLRDLTRNLILQKKFIEFPIDSD